MNLELNIINPLNYEGWDNLVLASQDYSFFHSSAWAKVLHETYKYRPHYFASITNNEIRALVPVMEINSSLTGLRA